LGLNLPVANAQIITTVAGNGTAGYSGDGVYATTSELNAAYAIAFDQAGNLYIADQSNNRVRKVNAAGIITTIAGNGTAGYSGDNSAAIAAALYRPNAVTFDNIGNIYFSDYGNSRIRRVNTSGIITTIAGTGTLGDSGDGGVATLAMINSPVGLAFDAIGNLFFTEEGGNRIRMINTSGIINTIAGTGTMGYSGDNGFATAAHLNTPGQITFDNLGNLYFADESNNRIRKINTAGIITTIAGTGTQGYTGDNGTATAAELYEPYGVACDNMGNVFISDTWNNVVRKINTSGIITTIAGTGFGAGGSCTGAYSGDGAAAILAELNATGGLTFDTSGNLYIADGCNNRIRKVSNVGQMAGIEQFANSNEQVTVYPNPATNNLQVSFSGNSTNTEITITDMLGNTVKQIPFNTQHLTLNIADLGEGVYNMLIQSSAFSINKKVVIVR
jgi:hypothetical protein